MSTSTTRTVYQVVDGATVFGTYLTTVTAPKTGKQYQVYHRIRSQVHEQGKCQCKASKTGCGRADFVAELYVVQDHHTRINPVIVAQRYMIGSHKDGTHQRLSENATIVTATVDDTVADDQTHPPLE